MFEVSLSGAAPNSTYVITCPARMSTCGAALTLHLRGDILTKDL
jgi:hypothetical protein